MKRIVLLILVVLTFIPNVIVMAKEKTRTTAKSCIIVDNNSNRILYQKNSKDPLLIASTTKIMTAILAIENLDLTKKITIGEEVLKMYGTNIYIEVGEVLTVEDLLYGLILRSGNDAATTLAIAVSGSVKEFVKLMNKKAKELNMQNTTFENPHGLDDDTKNYSTAYDMALLQKYAIKNQIYNEISSTTKYSTSSNKKSYLWYNRNKLLKNYKYTISGKNGYTPKAGKTFVSSASKDNLSLTIVTLDDSDIYENHQALYQNTFKKYKNYTIVDKNNFKISKNFYKNPIYLKESFTYPLTEEEKDNVKTIIKIANKEKNPIGRVDIYLDESIIGTVNIYKKQQKKEEHSFFHKVKNYFF